MRVGVLGCGNVGSALVKLIAQRGSAVKARTGVELEVTAVAVRDLSRQRDPVVAASLLSTNPSAVVEDPTVDVVVELMGGIEPALGLLLRALGSGKAVVTANKELLASHGGELRAAAWKAGVPLLYEAAVAGAIPLVRPLAESLAGELVERVTGIVNGTTNYLLTRMSEDGLGYDEALAQAKSLGLAEADPTADVEGHDAAAKVAILAGVAFGCEVLASDVYREGISGLRSVDVDFAARLGYAVKLLGVAERVGGSDSAPEVALRVHPAMVPLSHPLASVRGAYNAVFVEGAAAGELMFYGHGAGGLPTASAVLGDLVDAANAMVRRSQSRPVQALVPDVQVTRALPRAAVRPMGELRTQYYLNLEVADRPGVLAAVATVFGEHAVSIRSMEQVGLRDEARLIFLTHTAREDDMMATIAGLRRLDAVEHVGAMLRVLGPEGAAGNSYGDLPLGSLGGPT